MPTPPGKIKLQSYADDSNILNSGGGGGDYDIDAAPSSTFDL